jgi:hypothetical protein
MAAVNAQPNSRSRLSLQCPVGKIQQGHFAENDGQPTIVGNVAHSSASAMHRRWRISMHHQRNGQTYAEQVND